MYLKAALLWRQLLGPGATGTASTRCVSVGSASSVAVSSGRVLQPVSRQPLDEELLRRDRCSGIDFMRSRQARVSARRGACWPAWETWSTSRAVSVSRRVNTAPTLSSADAPKELGEARECREVHTGVGPSGPQGGMGRPKVRSRKLGSCSRAAWRLMQPVSNTQNDILRSLVSEVKGPQAARAGTSGLTEQ
jgi:hypothetical protein